MEEITHQIHLCVLLKVKGVWKQGFSKVVTMKRIPEVRDILLLAPGILGEVMSMDSSEKSIDVLLRVTLSDSKEEDIKRKFEEEGYEKTLS